MKGINFHDNVVKSGKMDPLFNKPLMPIKPICPPFGGGEG
jgi:hypothetical protein